MIIKFSILIHVSELCAGTSDGPQIPTHIIRKVWWFTEINTQNCPARLQMADIKRLLCRVVSLQYGKSDRGHHSGHRVWSVSHALHVQYHFIFRFYPNLQITLHSANQKSITWISHSSLISGWYIYCWTFSPPIYEWNIWR